MGYASGYQRGYNIGLAKLKDQQQTQLGELGQQYLGGDASVLPQIGGLDPQRAIQLQQLQAIQSKKQQQDLTRSSQLAKTILEADPEQRPEVYRASLAVAKNYGIDVGELPEFYSPEADKYLNDVVRFAEGIKGDQRQFGKVPEGYVLDPKTEEARQFKGLPKTTPEAQEKLFKRTTDLRKEYARESSEFTDVRNSYNRVQASVENPSPAGDISLLYNYIKILDPRSTVREGEMATVKNAGSIPQAIRARYNEATKGTLLDSSIRNDFLERAGKLYKQQELTQKKLEKQYRNIAKRQGISEQEAIIDVYNDKPQFTPEEIDQETKRRGL